VKPSRGDREAADFFAEEVRRLGREVVATVLREGATDFRRTERIREAVPDALFAVGSVEELLQMLPQAKFHDVQVQWLGLSHWNSDKLKRLARDELEGAVFPAESHYGSTPEEDAALAKKLATPGVRRVLAIAGYYILGRIEAIGDGAGSRIDVRAYLDQHLRRRGDTHTRWPRAAGARAGRSRRSV
jgi:ABC-type branched-subunit amino acid transport system substrate-binding protein